AVGQALRGDAGGLHGVVLEDDDVLPGDGSSALVNRPGLGPRGGKDQDDERKGERLHASLRLKSHAAPLNRREIARRAGLLSPRKGVTFEWILPVSPDKRQG